MRYNEKYFWRTYLMFFTNLLEANMNLKKISFDMTYYPKTESTNDDIWELYNDDKKNNHFVITDNQTDGRGRHNSSWESIPNKSITCSFLINQFFKEKKMNLNSILIPVAIINGIKHFTDINLEIKWPNDIIYNNNKLGGVLIESKNNLLNIGIGLNINQDIEDFPVKLTNQATSLNIIKGHHIQREPLLASIFTDLDRLIEQSDPDKIINEWMQYCSHINKKIKFKHNDLVIEGVFRKLNQYGQAIIELDNKLIIYNGAIETV